jgi:GDP-L-fucose synthase
VRSTPGARVFVAGHRGLVGSAVVRALASAGYPPPVVRTRSELDLRDRDAVSRFFTEERPRTVILAAATVGGIMANQARPWTFLYDNLAIETSVIGAALEYEVDRLVFLGSSCVYPREAPQPLREEYLLSGPLEATNEPYAVAKIAGIKLVEAATTQFGRRWISLMPSNLYGPGDNFDPEGSHVLPGLLARAHSALREASGGGAVLNVWGDGSPLREFLHVDDLARAVLIAIERDDTGILNVGSGREVSIRELAGIVAEVVDGRIELAWDASRPNGTPRKLLDSSRFVSATGWRPEIDLWEGVAATYRWYVENVAGRQTACTEDGILRGQPA